MFRKISSMYNRFIFSEFKDRRGVTRPKMILKKIGNGMTGFESVNIDGTSIFGNTEIGQFSKLYTFGYVEELEYIRFLDKKLSEKDSLLDIGAYYGLWASYFAERLSRVVAVEPNPNGRAFLSFNRDYYNRQFEIKKFALGSKEEQAELNIPNTDLGHASLAESNGETVSVDMKTADSQFSDFDAVKIDVEGAELEVLRGASSLLETIEILFLELHSSELLDGFNTSKKEVVDFISDKGFEIYTVENGELTDFEIGEGNQKLVCMK